MNNKNWKSMVFPILGVVALGVGTLGGLDQVQVDTLQSALETGATVVATLIGLYGVVKSHEKKDKDQK